MTVLAGEPVFQTLIDEQHVQIRRYESFSVAKIRVEIEEGDQNRQAAYLRLLSYVLGKNSREQKMKPMAPVFQEDVSARVSALLQLATDSTANKRAYEVSVVLPLELNPESAPLPRDEDIKIEKIGSHLTAVIKFSGFVGRKKRERLSKYLSIWIHDRGYTAVSAPRLAKYSPPYTLPFLRRNEIHIDVVRR